MKKKNAKKWMALFLALAMVVTSGVLTTAPGLLASEENTYETAQDQSQDTADTTGETADAQEQTSQEAQLPEDQTSQSSGTASQASGQSGSQASEHTASSEAAKTEEPSMPAQSFSGTASNGVSVKVSAPEGALPAGSTMVVTAVSAKTAKSIAEKTASAKVKDAVGVDITFKDASGNEIEPKKAVSVSMSLASKLDGDNFTVSHKSDSGQVNEVSASASAGGASFSESSFSIYVISGEGEEIIPVATYNFHDADGNVVDTQNVKTGDTLNKPSSPEKDGYKLVGWSTTKGSSTADFDGFGKVTVDKEETVNVYPVFQEAHYVFFMDGTEDSSRVSTTKEGVEGDRISTADVKLPLESTKSVTGWYTDKALTDPVGDTVTLGTKNIKLYPKIEEGHYLQFASGEGATYIAPQFVAANKGTKKPSDPKRPGYTFVGWSTEKDAATANFDFGGTISEDTTLYAVWKAKDDTSYTVVYWKQSVEDSKNAKDSQKTYEYAGSVSRTGTTGATVSPNYTDRNKNYTGFKYNSSKSQSVTVSGDGTTILNVYYDRELLTINFYGDQYKYVPTTSSSGWGTTYYGLVNGQYVEIQYSWRDSCWYYKSNGRYYRYNGTRYTRETTEDKETFTGLYGQTLAQNGYTWPSQKDWYNSSKNNHLTFLDAFIFDTLDEYGTSTEINLYGYDPRGNYTISHYKQNLDGSYSYDDPANSTSVNGGTFYFSNKYNGFTINSYSTDGVTWHDTSAGSSVKYNGNLYVRYSRNSYKLTYYNYNKTDKDVDVLYEAPLSGYADYVPEKPADLPDGYTFQGWYKDKECTVSFDFDTTMPVNDVMVYAKWAAPEVNGKAYLTVNGGGSVQLDIEYGDKIDASQLPSVYDSQGHIVQTGSSKKIVIPDGYDWKGWATKSGDSYTLFNFNTEIYSDIELYPFYVSNGKYKVEYSSGAGSGSVEDPKLYAEGSHADVQYASAIKAPKGKVFLYWQSESGDAYYPDDKIAVNGTNAGDDKIITLTAVYGNKADTASLTYNSNYPEGSIDTDGNQKVTQKYNGGTDLTNNTKLKTLTLEETGFTAPLGYEFTGWNTEADGSGKSIAADADPATEILVDNSGDNILYAQWKEKPKTEITVKPADKSKTYDGTALKADSYEITGGTLGEGDRIVATYSGSQINAGSSDSSFASFKIMHGNVDVTDLLYKVTKETGTLRVDPKEVTVTAEDKSKAYGEKDPELTAKVTGVLNDDKIQYSLSREAGEDVGSYTITPSGSEVQGNYAVKFVDGKLTISKSDKLTVAATGYEGVYDGESHAASAVANVTEGTTIFYKVGQDGEWTTDAPSIKDVGTKTVYVKAENSNYKTAEAEAVTLKVTKRLVTLTSETASKEYDGTPLTRPDVTVGGQGFVAGEVSDIKATGSQTEAGTSDNTISYTKEDGFKEGNYDISETIGTLTVTKNASKEIVLTAASGSKTYDGTPLKAGDATITGLPDGFTGEAVSGGETRTNAGVTVTKVKSYKIYNADGKDVTDQFTNVKYVDGKLTVNKRSVTLTSESATKVFDGTALTRPDVTGQEGFVSGEVTGVKATGSITKAGSVINTITYTAGKDFKESNYNIKKDEGKLTVTKVPVSQANVAVTANSNSWVYDGKSHSDDGYTVSGLDKMPEGFSVKATVEGSVKNVNDSGKENKITKAAIMYKGEDVTDQFESGVAIKNGVLNITAKPVVIHSASDSKVYDGKPLTNANVTFDEGKTFVEGEVKAEAVGTITKVGSTKNTIKLTVADGYTLDNYSITEDPGTLTVTPNSEAVTITARSASKPYDGTALTAGYDWTAPAGYTVEAKTSGSITDVGKVANKIDSYVVRDADGNDVTDQFSNIKTADGNLEVTKRQVTLTSGSATKEYDGTALTNGEVSGGDQFVAGEVSSVRATGSITKVGKTENTIEYDINDGFKAGNYNITKNPGTLKITANTTAAIKVKAPSDTKVYDGKTLKAGKAVVTGLPDGFTGTADSKGSIKDAGTAVTTVDNSTLVIRDVDGNDVTDQFSNITYRDGKLTVTKRNVTLKSESATKVFDGTALTRPEVTVGGQGFVDGEVKDIKATGSIIKAGSVTNTITYTENSAFDKDNYDITKDEGTLTIKKVPSEKADVVVTANSNSWVYDGKSHSDGGYTVSGLDKMPAGFSVKATVEGSVKNVEDSGTENRVTKAAIMYEGEDVTDQFESGVAAKNGVLNITKKSVVIQSASDSKVYDGKPLTNSKVTFQDGKTFVEGEVKAEGVGSITKAGSTKNTIKYTVADGYTLENYSIEEDLGILTVTKNSEAVTVTARSASKPYDGTALTAGYDWTAPAGYTVEAKTSGSITDVGKIANRIDSYVVRDADGNDVTDQFDNIKTTDGTLEVTKRQVVLTSGSAVKEYDGKALTNSEVTGGDQFVAGEVSNIRATGSITGVGKVKNTIKYDTNDGFKDGNYQITENPGTLEITANTSAKIKVTAASGSKKYDGTPLTAGAATVTGLPAGFTGAADSTGSIKDVGTLKTAVDKNSLVISDGDGKDVTSYFASIEYAAGELRIDPRSVTLTSGSASKPFDRTPLTNSDMTVGGDGFAAGEGASYTFTGSQTEQGESDNTFDYTLNDGTKSNNYSIEVNYGKLTVTAPILYTATIHYTDANGNTLAPDYIGQYMVGDSFSITSPAVSGYTPREAYVTMASMPERNVEVTVVYDRNPDVTPVTPVVPPVTPPVGPGFNPGTGITTGGAAIVAGPSGDTLTDLGDVKTPKANRTLHEKCNILPFLFMLLTMIVVIAYTHSMKKDQEEVFELTEDLEEKKRL